MLGYPLAMVLAEKIVTAIQRGTVNTRWRDFADIYTLIHAHTLAGPTLTTAISAVADYRGASIITLSIALRGYGALAQARWCSWRRKQQHRDQLPEDFDDVLSAVIAFADPALTRSEGAPRSWDPASLTWRTT